MQQALDRLQRVCRQHPAARLAAEAGTLALAAAATSALPRFPQPESYHRFAGDHRSLLGIPHAANVLSNFAIAVPGVAGLWQLLRLLLAGRRGRSGPPAVHAAAALPPVMSAAEGVCWAAVFGGMLMAAAGSARYHLDPNTGSLAGDRLGIALSMSAMLAAALAERRSRAGALLVLPVLLGAAGASVVHWQASEVAGRGDLRWYFLVQAVAGGGFGYLVLGYPPPPHRRPTTRLLLASLALYAAAVACDRLDRPMYWLTATAVSGHTIKHLLVGAAGWQLVRMLHQHQRDWHRHSKRE